MFRHFAVREVRVTQGKRLRKSPDGDSDVVDCAGIGGLDGAIDLKPQVLQLAVRLCDGKFPGLGHS